MITKAKILQLPKGAYTDENGNLVTDNKFKIYIPIFRRAGESKDSKLNASIMYATLMYNPGSENGYRVGDVVYISFENNQMGNPVILGKLFLNKSNESLNSSYLIGDNLNISNSAKLPLNTTIGNISGEEIEGLFQKVANNSNLIAQKQNIIDVDHKLLSDLVTDANQTNKFVTASDKTTWNNKQDKLVSGTNIKTINNESILGSGNITISTGIVYTGGSGININSNNEISVDKSIVVTKTNLANRGYVVSSNLSNVAFSGRYSDLSGAPDVNDGMLTVNIDGTKVLVFGANSDVSKTLNISTLKMHLITLMLSKDDGEGGTYDDCEYSFMLPLISSTKISNYSQLYSAMSFTGPAKRIPVCTCDVSTYHTFNAKSVYMYSNSIYLAEDNPINNHPLSWWTYINVSDSIIG